MNTADTLKKLYTKSRALNVFMLGLVLSAAFIVPVMIQHGGIFLYYGDFNAQEVPFYQLMHDEILRGNINWTTLTDLGASSLTSYLFYLIGSPFFWVTLLFPSETVPYLMGPLFMIKFACAGLTAYIYLKRYVKSPDYAVIGGILYAFSGFSIYNVFFFHFHEPMIMFPLLLYSVDRFMYDGKRGTLAAAVFACCIVNYYFFAGMAVFTAIYWVMLVFTDNYKITVKNVLLFIFEVVLGFAAAAFLVLPTVFFIMGNPRLSVFPDGYDALVYDIPQKYAAIITSFFFPPDLAAQPNFAPDADAKWASVSGWLPLVGMTGVIAYLQQKKRDWLKKLISLLILFALVPLFNSMFQLFNSSIFYARWYYMLLLILILATVKALESSQTDWGRAFMWSAGITLGLALLIGFMPNTIGEKNDDPYLKIGLQDFDERFWIYTAIAMVSLCAFAMIIYGFLKRPRLMSAAILAGICFLSILSSTYIVQTGNTLDYEEKEFLKANAINKAGTIDIADISDVRSDFYDCPDNLAMYWQIQSINAFHSVVTNGITEFYDGIGISRDVASRPDAEKYGIRALLSCKYLFDAQYDNDGDSGFVDEKGNTQMPGWEYLKTLNGCDVYENKYYIPMGFTYDSFVSEYEFSKTDIRFKSEAILKAMVLSSEDLLKYSDITGYSKSDIKQIKNGEENNTDIFKNKVKDYKYGKYAYFSDCEKLSQNTCESFKYNKDGFTAVFENKGKDNLLFFSVPYDEGWSAYINGKKAEIIKADFGFMAVKVDKNSKNKIVFRYEPVGFRTGIIISVVCVIIFVTYLCVLSITKRRRKIEAK